MIRRQEVVHWRSPEVSLTTRVRERERDREGVACGNEGGLGGTIDPIEIGTRIAPLSDSSMSTMAY